MTEHSRRKLLAATGAVIGSNAVLTTAAGAGQSTGPDSQRVIDVQVSNAFQATPNGDWTLDEIDVCPPRPDLQEQRDDRQNIGESTNFEAESTDLILAPAFFYDEDDLVVTNVDRFNSVRHIVYLEETSPTPDLDISKPDSSTLSIDVGNQGSANVSNVGNEHVAVPAKGKTEVPLFEREVTVRATQLGDERKEIPDIPEWRRPYETREKTITLPVETRAIVRSRKPEAVQVEN